MNKITSKLSAIVLILISFSCNEKKTCEIKNVKTLFTTIGIHDKDTGYCHYIIVENLTRDCLDSTTIVNMAVKYCDTVKTGNPVDVIMLFNSERDFIPNETSQDMDKINKSCLVVIGFDEKNRKPNDFIFYNNKGERVYWGNKWLPAVK